MTLLDGLATWQLIAVFAVPAGVVVGAGVLLTCLVLGVLWAGT